MMKEKDKISIIIAVYNTEKYIKKCLKSVLNQTFKNIEVLVVNDNSKDNSLKIIEEIAKEDKRVIVINNEINKGLSYNRNIALEKSTGNYIGYIDSDDYIAEDYYEKMYNKMKKEKADICICDMKLVYEKNGTEISVYSGGKDKVDYINNGLSASSCNKLFKREVISEYKFSEGKVNEDLAVILPTIIKSKKIVYEPSVAYNYVQRENSIQNSKISEKRFDIFYGVDLTLERIKDIKNFKDYKDAIVFQQLITLFLYVFCGEKNFLKRWKWFRMYAKRINKYNIKENQYLKKFLQESGKKHQIYYTVLLTLISIRFTLSATILQSVYNVLKKIVTKNVIPTEITLNDLKRLAKENSEQPELLSISVVVPNYNYEEFLYQRIYSILNQKIKIKELILLDDCSKDNSRKMIEEITKELKKFINIRYVFNKQNSGSAFKQWEKGFQEAKGDYVWICEADDYCDPLFLKNITKPIIENDNTVISYCDTAFINKEGEIIMRSIIPEIDILKTGHWDKDYVVNGEEEIKNYTYLNCTIANVSSALIKNGDYKEIFKEAGQFKQAGDWYFYTKIMQLGKIAYHSKALNYYRMHGSNVSSLMKKQKHFEEIQKIHNMLDKTYKLNKEQKKHIKERYEFLKKVWYLDNDNQSRGDKDE